MSAAVKTPPMERRILDDVRRHGCPRWFEIEDRLDIAGDHEALIAAWDARDSLVRSGRVVEIQLAGCETRFRLPSVSELEARMRFTASGEAPAERAA